MSKCPIWCVTSEWIFLKGKHPLTCRLQAVAPPYCKLWNSSSENSITQIFYFCRFPVCSGELGQQRTRALSYIWFALYAADCRPTSAELLQAACGGCRGAAAAANHTVDQDSSESDAMNRKYDVAEGSLSYAVGHDLIPVFFKPVFVHILWHH